MNIDCTVKYSAGAYVTSTVRGKRVSCTHSDVEAARRLGIKVFGERFSHIRRLHGEDGDQDVGITRYVIVGEEV